VDGCKFPLTRAAETQAIDIAQLQTAEDKGQLLSLIGSVEEKLAIRQELVQSKMAQIRKQTEDAERARLSRKTVTLDADPKNGNVKRKSPYNTPRQRSLGPKLGVMANRSLKSPFSTGTRSVPSSRVISSRPLSEQDSQQSWSPLLSDHASTGPTTHPPTLRGGEIKIATERKPPSMNLLPPRNAASKSGTYSQLEEEFSRRYAEYLALDQWVDDRLSVFKSLQKELTTTSTKSPTHEQTTFRLVVEEQRLKDDREYQEKLEKLEECCAALLMIKARLGTLVK
jgi:hypothetical protein